jgi:hypothetical protein
VKRWALVVVLTTGLLGAYLAWRAVDLISTGKAAGVLLGVGVLLLVGVGALLVQGEVRLAAASQRLGERMFDEGFVEDEMPLMPSGRVQRDAADALFDKRKAEAEANPEDWRSWWKLATAYDAARDPSRGRRAMRKAIALERAVEQP